MSVFSPDLKKCLEQEGERKPREQAMHHPRALWGNKPCTDNNSANKLMLLFLNKLLLLTSRGCWRWDAVNDKSSGTVELLLIHVLESLIMRST